MQGHQNSVIGRYRKLLGTLQSQQIKCIHRDDVFLCRLGHGPKLLRTREEDTAIQEPRPGFIPSREIRL